MLRKIASILLLVGATVTWAQTTQTILPNGMTVIVKEDHRAPVVMAQLHYQVGSVDEKAGKTGLSHALEHIMFKGTKMVPAGEYSRQLSQLGGQDNAYTSTEQTVYHVNIAAEHLPVFLKLEADRMANLNFSNRAFDNEMKIIREERRERIEDNPSGLLHAALIQAAWQKSPNRSSVIGEMRDLHRLKAQDLRQWYQQWYAPNNATLIVVGDVKPQTVFTQAQQYFGKIPRRTLPKRQDLNEETPKQNQHQQVYGQNTRPIMVLAYRVPPLRKIDDNLPYALNMLGNILDGHNASRFSKYLVRGKQVAQYVEISYVLLARQPQLWSIYTSPSAHSDTTQLKQALIDELTDIAQNGVSEEELNRARILENTQTIFAQDSMSDQADLIGLLHDAGFSYRDEDEIRRRINAVSAPEVQQAAQYLLQQPEIYIELLPKEK